jgi:hypothetical protein
VAVRVRQLHHILVPRRADLERQHQPAAGPDDARELPEEGVLLVLRDVDDRVPGERARQLRLPERQVEHRADGERDAGVLAPPTSTIPGERSIPATSRPSPAR